MIESIFGRKYFYKQDELYKNVFVYTCIYMPWCNKISISIYIIFWSNFFCLEGFCFFSIELIFIQWAKGNNIYSGQTLLLKISDVSRDMLNAHCKCLVKKQCIGLILVTGHHKAINYCKRHRDWAIHPRWDYSLHWTCTFHPLPDPPMRNPSGRGLLFCVWS